MFDHPSQPSLIYSYYARQPIEGVARIRDQMRAAHNYRNRLCALERLRRDEAAAVVREHSPELAEIEARYHSLKAELDAERARLKAMNKAERKRVVTPEQRAATKAKRDENRETYARLKELKAAVYDDPAVKARLKEVDDADLARRQEARKESGLYWGNYLAVEQAAQSFRSGTPPQFKRWSNRGRIVVQLQGGLSIDELFAGADMRLRIDPLADGGWESHVESAKRRTLVRIRIGSVGREPIWGVVPIHLHRAIPESARVKWAYLSVEPFGTGERWKFQLVLANADGWGKDDLASDGMAGVDLGWRRVPEGLRVAYWVGDDGAMGELILPQDLLDKRKHSRDVQGTWDENFDVAKAALSLFMESTAHPKWLEEHTKFLAQWRNHDRLAQVVDYWRENRFAGDELVFPEFDAWSQQDRHLLRWWKFEREACQNRRTALYREFAAMLRRRYSRAGVEDCDWSKLAKRAQPEETPDDGAAREHRFFAAVGTLREMIEETMPTTRVESAYTTQTCHACGESSAFDAKAELIATCPQCELAMDQDERAARNLLRAASEEVEAVTA